MADQDLELLARSSASMRQLMAAAILSFVLCIGTGWFLGAVVELSGKGIIAGVLGALVAAMAIGMRVPTPPNAFPTIRALRDRAADVAYVVTISRGSHVVALADHDGELLAKPLSLKGTARMPSAATAHSIIAAQSAQLTQALAIIARRCPTARTARITDTVGLASFKRLAKKAIAALPPA